MVEGYCQEKKSRPFGSMLTSAQSGRRSPRRLRCRPRARAAVRECGPDLAWLGRRSRCVLANPDLARGSGDARLLGNRTCACWPAIFIPAAPTMRCFEASRYVPRAVQHIGRSGHSSINVCMRASGTKMLGVAWYNISHRNLAEMMAHATSQFNRSPDGISGD